MKRIRTHLNYFVIFALLFISIFTLIQYSYAQSQGTHVTAPEPGSILLVSGGIIGWMVRYTRRRFHEFKRLYDIIVGSMGLVVSTPIIIFTAIVIKIVSPGPVFYTQERVGLKGRAFKIYKMRTMKLNAEKETGAVWAQENDPRLIRYGALIRKTHIDELPQLFNVLKGDMSIVGPRPERPIFVKKLDREIVDYTKRLKVRPGITGLAQVWNKYDETLYDVRKKVKYDLLYIREMCLLVDLRILLRTVLISARGKGAR